jgi:pimeloyl-ACP methyl ester carboxylesterase
MPFKARIFVVLIKKMRKIFLLIFFITLYFFSFSQDITGNWKGNIEVNGQQIPILFHFFKDSSGNIDGKWDSPNQHAINLPFSEISAVNDSVHLGIKMIGGSYNGKFFGNDSIAGIWQQNGAQLPLNFSRSTEQLKKTPLFPGERQISIVSHGGNKLYGTLLSKNNQQKLAIIIAGSGPTDRDGNSATGLDSANSYKLLAQSLDSQNIATFRYDKRGVAMSLSGDFQESSVTFNDYIKDAEKIYDYMHDTLGYKDIYFIGHSEGSLVGMIAAETVPVKGYISVAGAGRPIDKIIEEQLHANALPDSLNEDVNHIFNELKKGNEVSNVPSGLDFLFRKSIQPYFISWLKYDPAKEIKNLNCPVLILQGTCDKNVKVTDAEKLHEANKKSTLDIIPLMTHTLKNAGEGCSDDNNKTYKDPSLPINRKLVNDIVIFIKKW